MSTERLIDEKLQVFKNSLVASMNSVMARMYDDVMRDMRSELTVLRSEINSLREDMLAAKREVAAAKPNTNEEMSIVTIGESGAIIIKPEIERAIVGKVCKQLSAVLIPKVTEKVIDKVRSDLNENVIPMINNTLEYIGYATQDGQEVMTEYRREVMGASSGTKLLDDPRDARTTFGHVRFAFGEHD